MVRMVRDPLLHMPNPNLLYVLQLWPERALAMWKGGGCLGGGTKALDSSRFVRAADTGGGRRKKKEGRETVRLHTSTEGRRLRQKVRRSSSFCPRLSVFLVCGGVMWMPCWQLVLVSDGAVWAGQSGVSLQRDAEGKGQGGEIYRNQEVQLKWGGTSSLVCWGEGEAAGTWAVGGFSDEQHASCVNISHFLLCWGSQVSDHTLCSPTVWVLDMCVSVCETTLDSGGEEAGGGLLPQTCSYVLDQKSASCFYRLCDNTQDRSNISEQRFHSGVRSLRAGSFVLQHVCNDESNLEVCSGHPGVFRLRTCSWSSNLIGWGTKGTPGKSKGYQRRLSRLTSLPLPGLKAGAGPPHGPAPSLGPEERNRGRSW